MAELKRRGRGRPGRGTEPAQVVAVRLTTEELVALDAAAARENLSRSEAIRRALAAFIWRDAGGLMQGTPEAERMHQAFEMHAFGVALYRQRMRRENPGADESEIEVLTRAWLAAPKPRDSSRQEREAR